MPPARHSLCLLVTATLCIGAGLPARAQGHGGGGPGGPGGPPMEPGGPGFGAPFHPGSPPPNVSKGEPVSSMRGGLQLGPPGRWWTDKRFAENLGLSSEQQKRMDAIFNENRTALIARFQALQDEEARTEALTRASSPDEGALFAEIDRLAGARAALEKANVHMLLSIRREMSADQLARLASHR